MRKLSLRDVKKCGVKPSMTPGYLACSCYSPCPPDGRTRCASWRNVWALLAKSLSSWACSSIEAQPATRKCMHALMGVHLLLTSEERGQFCSREYGDKQ